ncbi:zinc-ribbon domain-containing protein [Streptomyces melanogenes]|uniref:Zinc ribbon domain-containing protein n=1 Tax=Streptomyces melanogenes TaxID=67326 RepID=A0ABZ1XRA9_9ACTN|nr:zinc-ribbon domain-containing protein [Streptomyces melanogenes]
MLIWGTKGYLYQLAMMTLVCGNCGNPAAHGLRKYVTKFTLFFIPLFPVSTKYRTQCTFCGMEQQITKEAAEQLLATAAAPQPGYQAQPQQMQGQAPGQPHGQNPYQQ